jgi:hypothetical protein
MRRMLAMMMMMMMMKTSGGFGVVVVGGCWYSTVQSSAVQSWCGILQVHTAERPAKVGRGATMKIKEAAAGERQAKLEWCR